MNCSRFLLHNVDFLDFALFLDYFTIKATEIGVGNRLLEIITLQIWCFAKMWRWIQKLFSTIISHFFHTAVRYLKSNWFQGTDHCKISFWIAILTDQLSGYIRYQKLCTAAEFPTGSQPLNSIESSLHQQLRNIWSAANLVLPPGYRRTDGQTDRRRDGQKDTHHTWCLTRGALTSNSDFELEWSLLLRSLERYVNHLRTEIEIVQR